jgi:phosphatidylglycerophosphatase A
MGFFLFRLFDILKPWPLRRLERLPGGAGIMMDDVGAGAIAALILFAFLYIRLV